MKRVVLAAAAVLCLSCARKPELVSCKLPGMPAGALCGTYEVFENREARTGRKIPLQIVVLPAAGPDRLPDPIVYFAGHPESVRTATMDGVVAPDMRGPLGIARATQELGRRSWRRSSRTCRRC